MRRILPGKDTGKPCRGESQRRPVVGRSAVKILQAASFQLSAVLGIAMRPSGGSGLAMELAAPLLMVSVQMLGMLEMRLWQKLAPGL
jgi:hypothetical protein